VSGDAMFFLCFKRIINSALSPALHLQVKINQIQMKETATENAATQEKARALRIASKCSTAGHP
jgi:hypothetical protein